MNKSQTHDLADFLDQTYSGLKNEYNRLRKRSKEDPGTAGDQGEENWKMILKQWLPHYFKIETKGRLINENGYVSPQVDIVILRPEYPEYLLSRKLYLTGGVVAAFEVKTTLRLEHLSKFFKTCIEIKRNTNRNFATPPTVYSDIQKPILFGLLAHSYDRKLDKLSSARKIQSKVRELDKQLIDHPALMPDLICISDLITISARKIVEGEKNKGPLAYYINYPTLGINEMHTDDRTPIAALLTQLLHKLSYQYNSIQNIAYYFSLSGVQRVGSGLGRQYGREVYSEQVKDILKNKEFIPYKDIYDWRSID